MMLPFNKGNRILAILLKKERVHGNKAAVKFYNSYLLPFILLTLAIGLLVYHGAGYNTLANLFEVTTFTGIIFSLFLLFKLYHTDRNAKVAGQKSRVNELRFDKIYDSGMIALLIADMDGSVKQANDAFLSMIGYTQADLEAGLINWRELSAPEYEEVTDRAIRQLKETGTCDPFEKEYICKNGEKINVLLGSAMLSKEGGHEIVGYALNITARKAAEKREQELGDQLIRQHRLLMQKKDEFLGIATHELKTPITSMKASLQILENTFKQKNPDIERVVPIVTLANKQVKKLTNIVEDLLDVTKIQSGNIQLNKIKYDFNESIDDSLQEIHQQIQKHEIIIEKGGPVQITADRTRLEQVIINLLSNAVKYSPKQGRIVISVIINNNELYFSVTDQGIGIPADKQAYIFDRFFRVHESSQVFAGLGLGLFISSEIIRQHGGSIGMESEEDKGSTFWFTLPLQNSDARSS